MNIQWSVTPRTPLPESSMPPAFAIYGTTNNEKVTLGKSIVPSLKGLNDLGLPSLPERKIKWDSVLAVALKKMIGIRNHLMKVASPYAYYPLITDDFGLYIKNKKANKIMGIRTKTWFTHHRKKGDLLTQLEPFEGSDVEYRLGLVLDDPIRGFQWQYLATHLFKLDLTLLRQGKVTSVNDLVKLISKKEDPAAPPAIYSQLNPSNKAKNSVRAQVFLDLKNRGSTEELSYLNKLA
ncbi:MAG: hypothetical protein QE263_03025 [Vampirovibrionales bacterium]|nr:hypothetical protein [Vampirovibrionales bacterium]